MEAGFFWTKARKVNQQQAQPLDQDQQQKLKAKDEGGSRRSMSQPSELPRLAPQFCFNERALRANPDFLRISRGMIDDSIVQNLNALVTPSKRPFDPSSTAERQIRPSQNRPIDRQACQSFKDDVLFRSWQVRSDVLNYCAGVALDPGDPDLLLREIESAKEKERVVDERLDPYSGRFFPREARTEALANLIRNERSVENIIRARTWGLVSERCGDLGQGWESALNRWRVGTENFR
ncbi:hypothetical protein MMC22_006410 [Lobaria immixta]|nr:hypothetical protein [Lobaria immixta]